MSSEFDTFEVVRVYEDIAWCAIIREDEIVGICLIKSDESCIISGGSACE
jgi:hypothetical protein